MPNPIDIIINAKWKGQAAFQAAAGGMRQLGDNAAKTSIEMAAAQQTAALLNTKLAELGKQVALNKISVKEATAEYQKFAASLQQVQVTAAPTQKGMGSLLATIGKAAFAVGSVTFAINLLLNQFKKLGAFIKEGANIELIEQRFDRLARTMGTTGDVLKDDLSGAMRGLRSEVEGMKLATDLMALGLVKNRDEAIRLSAVAAQLNFDMNELVLTLTNQTVRRFDQLGVSVDGFKQRVKELEDAGYDTNEAFRLAFIAQSEAQIEKVGSVIDSTAGKIEIMQSAWSNISNTLKTEVSDAFGSVVSKIADIIVAANDAETAVRNFFNAADDADLMKEAVDKVREAIELIGPIGNLFTPGSNVQIKEAIADLAATIAAGGETFLEQKQLLAGAGFELDEYGAKLGDIGVSWSTLATKIPIKQLELLAKNLDAIELARFGNQATDTSNRLESGLLTWDALLVKLGYVDEETGKVTEKFEKLAEAADFGEIDLGGLDVSKSILNETTRAGIVAALRTQVSLGIEQGIQEGAQERLDIWLDFQSDLSTISADEAERRAQLEEQYEERRTDIVEQYEARRADIQEDSERRINRIRSDSADRQADIRQEGNERLAELEEDHASRIREIIENADLELKEAAAGLDAAAVARIKRQREDALQDETEAYQDQRQDIMRETDKRIQEEQEAANKRIEIERENNALRLEELEEAHQDQLDELKEQHDDELDELREQAERKRQERENEYIQERTQLDNHWRAKSDLELQWMNSMLAQEAEFWRQRQGLIGTGGTGEITVEPAEQPSDGGGGGTEETPPSHLWLVNTASRIANEKYGPLTTAEALNWYRYFNELNDAQIAAWIEANSELDVPYYAAGARNIRGGLAIVGERGPELVQLPEGANIYNAGRTAEILRSSMSFGDISIIVNEAERPGDTAEEVRIELERFFRNLI